LTDAFQLLRHPLIGRDDLIERIGDLSLDPEMVASHSYRKVSASHRLQRLKQFLRRVRLAVRVWFDFGATAIGRSGRTEITHGIPLKQMGLESEHVRVNYFAS
jgi:hypothetical protein